MRFKQFINEDSHKEEADIKKRMEKIAKKMKARYVWGVKSPMPKGRITGFDLKRRMKGWKIEYSTDKPKAGHMFLSRAMEITNDTSDANLKKIMVSVKKKADSKK